MKTFIKFIKFINALLVGLWCSLAYDVATGSFEPSSEFVVILMGLLAFHNFTNFILDR